MLGKISHWLAARQEKDGAADAYFRMRYDALRRLKHATLAVVHKDTAGEEGAESDGAPAAREQRKLLTQTDDCVRDLCVALEDCLQLGLKRHSNAEEPSSWWKVLYASTLIVDEPTLVQSVLSAAFLSETDAGKARCWMKMALNNHTIESSLMMIFSMACEHLIRANYEDWSLARCSEGLGLFLELIIDLRDVHFAIEVNEEPFREPESVEAADKPEENGEESSGGMVSTITEAAIAAAARVLPSMAESAASGGLDDAENSNSMDEEIQRADGDYVEVSLVSFSHRNKGIKPWQHVFGVSLASLCKNPYHSRFALIDPMLVTPNIVEDCIAIVKHHPDTPRLFRATVLNVRVSELREVVETEGALPVDLDAQDAGALLLDFFKHLPEPLLTEDKYDAFVACGQLRDEEASVRNITYLVHDLPTHCQAVLEKLICLMHFLQQPEHATHNGMDGITASMALGPVIAFKRETPGATQQRGAHAQYQDLRYAAVGSKVVERMIQHYDTIFQDVRVRISDALERLETKREALKQVSRLLKLQPQSSFSSDRQQIDEITRVFQENAGSSSGNADEMKPGEGFKADASENVNFDASRERDQDASEPSRNSAWTEQNVVNVWQQHGFNSTTVLGNFEKGGVLLLRSLSYLLKNDSNAAARLKLSALPSTAPTYDAGLVASAICKALVKLLKLELSLEQSELDMVSLSLEPFWELLDEDAYFYKLFVFMFDVFDQTWGDLEPGAASFTRVFCETEATMDELLKNAPASVEDLRSDWESTKGQRVAEAQLGEHQEKEELAEDKLSDLVALSSHPPQPCITSLPSRKMSLDYKESDMKAKLLDASSILSWEQVAYLDRTLPVTCQLCRWFRIYSLEANGSSLETLLTLAKSQSPTLLVVKDAEGNVFGGFASEPWHRALHYYGTGEAFLFSFASANRAGGFAKYAWSRKNSYFMLSSEDSLIMGGGGSFGLFLDSDLASGSTGACETFNSPPLTASQEFSCVQVELWGFTTGEKPTNLGGRRKKSVLD